MLAQISKVKDCSVGMCAYNRDNKCFALAVDINDAPIACSSFVNSTTKCAIPDISGLVGACKANTCRFNNYSECSADSICVQWSGNCARCATFESN